MRWEENLLAICTALSLIGIAALYIYAQLISPRAMAIAEIDLVAPGSYISIAGFVEEIKEREQTLSARLCDHSACISVLIFKRNIGLFLHKGQSVVINGIVRDYAGRRYIEAKHIASIEVR